MTTLEKINELLENPEQKEKVIELLDHIDAGDVSSDIITIHNYVCHNADSEEGIQKETRIKLWNVYETAKLIKAIEDELKKIDIEENLNGEEKSKNFINTDEYRHLERLWNFLGKSGLNKKILLRKIYDYVFPTFIGPEKETWKWMIQEIEKWSKMNGYKTKTETIGEWDFIELRKEAENV